MKTLELAFDFALQLREAPQDGTVGTIYGRAVPYDTATDIGGMRESFGPAAFDPADVIGKPLAWRHGDPIGVITDASNEPDGLYITADLLDTAQGRDAAVLARRQAVKGLSVGFTPLKTTWNKARTAMRHTAARLAEVSLTHMPAYPTAGIASVREGEAMPEVIEAEVREAPAVDVEAREAIAAANTRLDELAAAVHVTEPARHELAQFRSFGDYRKAVLEGAIESRALFDQVTGDNPGVMPPIWSQTIRGIVDGGRPSITALGVESAGTEGLEFNWPVFAGNIADIVEQQENEKTEINSVQISITKESASLETYAAGSDISYQLLQRSSPSYLDAHGRIMAAAYAYKSNKAFVDALWSDGAGGVTYDYTGDSTGSAFRQAVFEASVAVESATGMPASVVIVGSAVFNKIGSWEAFWPAPYGVQNVPGTATASTLAVSVSGLPVVHDRTANSGAIIVTNGMCAKWIEDGPRLANAEDVSKLGRDVAIYGYGLAALYVPAGIVLLAD